jgi:hypothetical protein
MVSLPLDKVLDGFPGVKKDGASYLLSEELDATAFVSIGQEVLQIPRLSRVDGGEILTFHTHKGERFFFPFEQLVGIKFGGEAKANRPSAGFR